MGIKQRLEADIKTALLSGDKKQATILRTLKSVILEAEIAQNKRDSGLEEDALMQLLSKEAKKRQDAVDLYSKAGEAERAANEQHEQEVISTYLPSQLDDTELEALVDEAIAAMGGNAGPQAMGALIGAVRAKAEGRADGGRIAAMVKRKLGQ